MRAAGLIQPLDSRAPSPRDADALKILAAPREVLGVSRGSEPWEKGGGVVGKGGAVQLVIRTGPKSQSQGKPNKGDSNTTVMILERQEN